MSDADGSLDEKRVFADRDGATTLYVAGDAGLARVSVSDDVVGEFGLELRGTVRDVAVAGGRPAVATPDDVLVGTDGEFVETGFGPAEAVGRGPDGERGAGGDVSPAGDVSAAEDVSAAGDVIAAGAGRVARYDEDWTTLGACEDVRAIDGDVLAAAAGVHRLDGTHVGLSDARDVSTAGGPLAATGSGLYYLANGWISALEREFTTVASRPDGRAHAATRNVLYARDSRDDEWATVDLPVDEAIADVAYGPQSSGGDVATYAVTQPGTVLADAGDGWRYRSLGLPAAQALAVG